MLRHFSLIFAILLTAITPLCAAGEKVDFDQQVAPILAERCLGCHSGAKPKGGLDLTGSKAVLKGTKNGPAVIAGKPEESPLWTRVEAGEMPPKKPLSAEEKAILKTWIAKGAGWGTDPIDPLRMTTKQRAGFDWWSLKPLRRPVSPKGGDAAWPINPIDRFVLERLDAAGLKPSAEADRRTLIRRLSLDLLGLPPTWEEVDAFVRDERPDAYERLVDRLLASPHYGERWAQHWLDVVRYGESGGFERNDPRRNSWHYRDWVVQAFSADMPYDQFCRLQLAGDILQPGDPDAIKASGYLVAGIHNTVLPGIKALQDAAFHEELEDLVGNVGQTFLGMTANCARCHDHKFDPISQIDYYRLASALSGVRHGEAELPSPNFKAETDRISAALAEIAKRLTEMDAPIRKEIMAARKAPVASGPAPIAAWDFREGGKDRIGNLHAQPSGGARFTSDGLVLDGKLAFARTPTIPRALREKTLEAWVRLANLDQRGGGVMTIEEGDKFDAIVFGEQEAKRWMAGSDFFKRTKSAGGPLETAAPSRPVHIAIAYRADGTIAIYRDGLPYGQSYVSSGPQSFNANQAHIKFGNRHGVPGGNKMLAGIVERARLYDRALTNDEIAISAKVENFVTETELVARLTEPQRAKRTDLLKQRAELETQLAKVKPGKGAKAYTNRPVMPQTMRVMHRGQVSEPGNVVSPGGVAALGKADFKLEPNVAEGTRRVKLAEWITSPENPLFARVMVNRLWHHHFGIGIVETPSDFGFNGGRPSHPELLDWLASEFVERGYRLKEMHRLIVTSRTYRQSSMPKIDGLKKDAESRLLWRKRPMRIEGEVLRDSLLAVTGLLDRSVGGQGFSDYKENNNAGTTYFDPIDPVGPQFHRRSLYRFRPRSASQGLLDAFDCPDTAGSAPRRNVTTTPLQALALWNGPFALRMADTLADRIRKAKAPEGEVVASYRLVLQRDPTMEERGRATRLVEQHGVRALARVLFNSNEFLVIE